MLWAYDFQSGDLYYTITSDVEPYTVEVTYQKSWYYFGDITIPSSVTYNGITYAVTRIGYQAFYNCSSLTSVTIPNSVTSIGGSAFNDCSSLTSVTIPTSVTSIGSQAFYRCSSLTSVTIPNSVTSIDGTAFGYCSSLTSVTIPSSVTSIRWGTFYNCSSLTSVTIPSSVTSIAGWAFRNCSSLTSVTIPSSVTSIAGWAFRGCSSLNTIYVGATTPPALGDSTFADTLYPICYIPCGTKAAYEASDWASQVSEFVEECEEGRQIIYTSTDGNIVNPNKTDVFGANIVSNTYENGVGTITFDSPVTSIEINAFYDCSSLTSVTIPNSVTSIGNNAFKYCSSLTSVTIPNSVTSIGSGAFKFCSSLTSVTIPNSVTSIGSGAFKYCSSLTSVTIPKSVETIGQEAFMDCKALTNVTISNGVMKIGGEAFRGCPSLTSVFIPSSVTSIGGNPFDACPGITSIVVDENNSKYDSRNNCNGIIETAANRLITGCQNTIIPYGVTNIDHAFWGCSSLKEITIPNTVTNIGTYTFESCSLTSIVIPKSVTSIGDRAFSFCPLSTIVVEEGNPKYDSRNHCNAIIITSTNTLLAGSDNTIIPEGITAISPNAFRGRKHIASIAIPNSVTRIGEYAFNECNSLTSITIPDGVTAIKTFAFSSCDALTSVIIGKGVNSVEQGAFFNSPVETVYFNAQEPAIGLELVTGYRYFSTSPTCYIPCGTRAAYEASVWNDYMESFIETYEYTLTLSSSDNSMGSATITQEPACGTPAIIVATPNDGYFFSQWSDGNTDNPRTLTVNEDIELAAEFEEIGDYGFYSRNVHIGYNTICLPHGSSHFTGATFYEIAHILKNKKKIFFDEVKTLEAGKPYIFYPHSNEVTVYYDNTTSAVPLSHNGLHGTFDGITAASNFLKGKYLVAGDRMVLCGDGCSLAANRAYIVLDEISDKDHPAIPGIKRVSMDYSEENATTALDNITDESIVAPIQEGVYDILGRKVDAPTVSGFYIINGKKVFVAL